MLLNGPRVTLYSAASGVTGEVEQPPSKLKNTQNFAIKFARYTYGKDIALVRAEWFTSSARGYVGALFSFWTLLFLSISMHFFALFLG